MPLPPQKFREIVFQILYSQDLVDSAPEEMIPLLMKELSVTKKAVRDAQKKAARILDKLETLDSLIADTSESYAFDRIHSIERSVLRLGVYELLFDEEIPPKVAITEGMRIAKKFGSAASASFVNALLDAIHKKHKGETVDLKALEESVKELEKSEEETAIVSEKIATSEEENE